MNEIIGRIHEKKQLELAFKSTDAEFVAVYGRRRVGKTYLIRHFFKSKINSKKCIFFQTTGIYKGSLKDQLDQFSKELGTSFYQGADIKVPGTWFDAFDKLTHQPYSINRQYANALANKIEVFKHATKTEKQLFLAFISANGLKQTMYSEEIVNGGIVVLEDFFKVV